MGYGRDALARLIDERDITQLLYRRVSGLDRRDVAAQLECFAPGAVYVHGSFHGTFADFIATASQTAGPNSPVEVVSHLVSNLMIDFEDDDHARTTCTFLVVARRGESAGNVDTIQVGRYLDDVVRHEDRWLISKREVEFHWSQIAPRTPVDAWILHDPGHRAQ